MIRNKTEEEEEYKDVTPPKLVATFVTNSVCTVLMDVYSIYSFIKSKSYLR